MAATCGANFAKFVLIVFNILFLIIGILLICLGGWVLGDKNITKPFETVQDVAASSLLSHAAIILIVFGALIFFFTIFGLVAAIKEHPVLLGIYIAVLVIICIGEIAGGVVAIVFKDEMLDKMYTGMQNSLKKHRNATNGEYYTKEGSTCESIDNAAPWDFFQYNGKCCGLDGKADYATLNYNFKLQTLCSLDGGSTNSVPWSCCVKKAGASGGLDPDFEEVDCTKGYYNEGCYDKLVFNVQRYAPVLIGIGLGFGFVQLFGIVFAVCLCQNPGKDY